MAVKNNPIKIVFLLGSDRPSGHLSLVPSLLLSILTPLFLPSRLSLSYLIPSVLELEVLGEHTCMVLPFPLFGAKETRHAQRTLLQAVPEVAIHTINLKLNPYSHMNCTSFFIFCESET